MVVCASGSTPVDGAPLIYYVSDADLQRYFGSAYSKLGVEIVGQFVNRAYSVTDVCAVDPPLVSLPTQLEVEAAILTGLVGWQNLIGRFDAFIRACVWSDQCRCNPGAVGWCTNATYTIPVGASFLDTSCLPPGSYYVLNAPAAPVNQTHMGIHIPGPPATDTYWEVYGPGLAECIWTGTWHVADGDLNIERDLPSQWGANTWALVLAPYTTAGRAPLVGRTITWQWRNKTTEPACSYLPTPVPPPAPPNYSGLPNAPVQTGCTTDDLCKALQEVRAIAKSTSDMATLIQRQIAPFAYIPAATYAGLTGTGTIAVQGILGASVSIAGISASWGHTAETPPRYIPALGTIQFGTADGLDSGVLLHYTHDLLLSVSGAATVLRYNLKPGITASITTLRREFA